MNYSEMRHFQKHEAFQFLKREQGTNITPTLCFDGQRNIFLRAIMGSLLKRIPEDKRCKRNQDLTESSDVVLVNHAVVVSLAATTEKRKQGWVLSASRHCTKALWLIQGHTK